MDDGTTRYYRSFDKFALTGIDELPFAPFSILNISIGYPHVAVTRGVADSPWRVTAAVSHDCRAIRYYESRDGIFFWRESFSAIDTEWDGSESVCYVHDAAEICYLYQINDSEPPVQRALSSFSQETRSQRIRYVFLTALFTPKLVGQQIEFRSDSPLPASVRQKALYIETTTYARDSAGRVTHETTTTQRLEDGQPVGSPRVRERDRAPSPTPSYIREALSSSDCMFDK